MAAQNTVAVEDTTGQPTAGTGTTFISLRGLPTPHRDQALYDLVVASGFAMFPNRRENYERYKQSKRGDVLDYLPIQLDIENVSRCNFRCTMCQVSSWTKGQRGRDMTFEEFKELIDEQIGLLEIKLQGMGEPLMAGDTFFQMIEYARSRHIWVRGTVNGSLLHIKDNYRKLIDSDICEVHVSIDGATKETFEAIRRGSRFEMVTRNAKLLNEYAQKVGKHRTRMWSVIQSSNYYELEALVRLAAELGFGRLSLSMDLNDWGQDQWREKNDKVDAQEWFDVDTGEYLMRLGNELGLEVTFWCLDEKYDTSSPETLCNWPFERGFVSSDMRFVPCCMIANPQVSDLGAADKLATVWNSQAMQEFRSAHLSGNIPSLCRTCYKGTS